MPTPLSIHRPQRGFVSHVFLMVAISLAVLCILASIALTVAEWLNLGLLGAAGLFVAGVGLLVLLLQLENIIRWVRKRRRM